MLDMTLNPLQNTFDKICYKLKVWGIFIHLLRRQIHNRVSLLFKCLLYPLKKLPLPGILFCMTKEDCSLW